MPSIRFKAKPYNIGSWTVIRLPQAASAKLSSRGMAMAEVTINGSDFTVPLEPDGKRSHWFRMTAPMIKSSKIKTGKELDVVLQPLEDWPDPTIPPDIKKEIYADPAAKKMWQAITPKARWDWLRWIRATNNPETRKKHIKVAISKMNKGEQRPCCFNRNTCTVPEVSKSGVLRDEKGQN